MQPTIDFRSPHTYSSEASHEAYRWLRQNDPVHRVETPRGQAWVLSKYKDIVDACTDPELFSTAGGAEPPDVLCKQSPRAVPVPRFALVNLDPPRHRALRQPISTFFSPKQMANYEGRISSAIQRALSATPSSGVFDGITAIAETVPFFVATELMGLPESDYPKLLSWVDALVDSGKRPTPASVRSAVVEGAGYFNDVLKQRRESPGDDLISHVIAAKDAGAAIGDDDLLIYCFNLMVGGNQAPRQFFAGGLYALAAHPEVRRQLRDEPHRVREAVEEILRWYTPVTAMARWATRDVALHGQQIRAGDGIILLFQSGNRDEEIWGDDSDCFRLGRSRPQRHLGFGYAEHICLGMALARLEGRIAFRALLDRLPEFSLAGEPIKGESYQVNAMTYLPLRAGSAAFTTVSERE